MSRAIRPRQHGGPEVLAVVDVPTPRPGAGEVVVRVRAAGVNPIDWKLYGGDFHEVDDDQRDEAGLTEEMPTLGLECAGVVVEVGAEVSSARRSSSTRSPRRTRTTWSRRRPRSSAGRPRSARRRPPA
ncbi:alcohol dehydrogenase catalytic domain-containing protein [Clavibacter michiganensis]|uniref:alcohol dehydrogenase catalytic domain-containing protein n=1 Tax=Clavibacter michiganensis TaxID=28447 RepID=UPI00292E9ACA|nr:alcohol dehydrogenase catalytic domain-containing protein [Clavibacter michiganensis]